MIENANTSVVVYLDKYCVYTHSVDGDVFYVGKGTGVRPFTFTQRNEAWNSITGGAGRIEVNIIHWCDSEAEALAVERLTVRKLRPIANVAEGGGGVRSKSLINRGGGRYRPTVLNVARLTQYGHIGDRATFDLILRDHLGISDHGEIPKDWAAAYNAYFFEPDKEYLEKRNRKVCVKVNGRNQLMDTKELCKFVGG